MSLPDRDSKEYPTDEWTLRVTECDPRSLSPDTYVQAYFKHLRDHLPFYHRLFNEVLDKACALAGREASTLTILDFGCGNGLLGTLAAYRGFQRVVCCDADPVFLEAARNLAHQLDCTHMEFIPGPEQMPIRHSPSIVLVATDVIEHLYSLKRFFQDMRQLQPDMPMVFTTAAHAEHPLIRRRLRRLQLRDERLGYKDPGGATERSHPSYLQMRESMLTEWYPDLSRAQCAMLARQTRGLRRDDIRLAADRFLREGLKPVSLRDAYNTCHPETGSWTERLLPRKEWQSLFAAEGYVLQVSPGYYNDFRTGIRGWINRMLNGWIRAGGRRWAPFLFFCAKKCETKR